MTDQEGEVQDSPADLPVIEDDWTDNEEVDWDADHDGVEGLTVKIDSEEMTFRAEDLDHSEANIHIHDGNVQLIGYADDGEIEASSRQEYTPEEARKLARQLWFAGKAAEHREGADVRF